MTKTRCRVPFVQRAVKVTIKVALKFSFRTRAPSSLREDGLLADHDY